MSLCSRGRGRGEPEEKSTTRGERSIRKAAILLESRSGLLFRKRDEQGRGGYLSRKRGGRTKGGRRASVFSRKAVYLLEEGDIVGGRRKEGRRSTVEINCPGKALKLCKRGGRHF